MKKKRKTKIQLIEITRSFSFKKNLGNFENIDFFCSQKAQCEPKDAEKVSEALHAFCRQEVIKSLNALRKPDEKKIKDESKTEAQLDAGISDFGEPDSHPYGNID